MPVGHHCAGGPAGTQADTPTAASSRLSANARATGGLCLAGKIPLVAGGEVLLGVLVLLANAPLAAHVLSRAAYRARGKPQYGRLDDALQQERDKD